MSDLHKKLAAADIDTLREIIREAESYMSAQLTVTLASNQRAVALTNILAAVSVVLIGTGTSLMVPGGRDWQLGAIAILVAGGLLFAMRYASWAFSPSPFHYVGNTPSQWVDDIVEGKAFRESLAEQAGHYDQSISDNLETLGQQGRYVRRALATCWWSLVAGGVFAGAHAIGRLVAS